MTHATSWASSMNARYASRCIPCSSVFARSRVTVDRRHPCRSLNVSTSRSSRGSDAGDRRIQWRHAQSDQHGSTRQRPPSGFGTTLPSTGPRIRPCRISRPPSPDGGGQAVRDDELDRSRVGHDSIENRNCRLKPDRVKKRRLMVFDPMIHDPLFAYRPFRRTDSSLPSRQGPDSVGGYIATADQLSTTVIHSRGERSIGLAVEMRPCDAEDIRSLAMTEHPTAIVSWAHSSPGWTPERQERWRAEVIALVDVLRDNGVDADIDLHHSGDVDWTRFGPQAIVDKAWVLGALSSSWKERWEGRNEPTTGAGAAGEANALRSLWVANQTAFRNKLVLLTLPMMRDQTLTPVELHGIEHFRIPELTSEAVIPLLRLLTHQPAYPKRRLGPIPRLHPESRSPDDYVVDRSKSPPTQSNPVEEEPENRPQVGEDNAVDLEQPEPDTDERSRTGISGTSRRRTGIILQPPRSAQELFDAAPKPEGSPHHWSLYEGMLLLRFVAAALRPGSVRLQGAAAPARLESASSQALSWINDNLRPSAAGQLQNAIARGWRPASPKRWVVGRSTDSPEEMIRRPTAGVVMTTDPPILAADLTIPTSVVRDGQLRYYAAHEPRIAADLLTLIVLATNLMTEARALELAVFISAAPRSEPIVSAESYAQYPFDDPHDGISPTGPYPDHFWSETARVSLDTLDEDPWTAARALLDDWLITFRARDLFDDIRNEPATAPVVAEIAEGSEIASPRQIEQELRDIVELAATDLLDRDGEPTAAETREWIGKAEVTIRHRCGSSYAAVFRSKGRNLSPRDELNSKIAYVLDDLVPKAQGNLFR